MAANTPPDEATIATIMQGLYDNSAKRRESTIKRYVEMRQRDARIDQVIGNLATTDPVPYVREAAQSAVKQLLIIPNSAASGTAPIIPLPAKPRPTHRARNLLLGIAALIVVCIIAGIAIAMTPSAPKTTQPASIAQATSTLQKASTISANTPVPADTSVKGYIPGLLAADVTVNLKNRGFTCTDATKLKSFWTWTCKHETSAAAYDVVMYARDVNSIDYVDANALQFTSPDDQFAIDFLGYIASIPYDNANPAKAQEWVKTTIPTLKGVGDVHETTISGVRFRLFGIPTARTLEIGELKE